MVGLVCMLVGRGVVVVVAMVESRSFGSAASAAGRVALQRCLRSRSWRSLHR